MTERTLKKCFKCNVTKKISEFYKHKDMADGVLGKCKECAKKDAREHRNANIDNVRLYDRQRAKLPHRRKLSREYSEKYNNLFPLKRKAQWMVSNAIRSNKYIKPKLCQVCENDRKLEGHHDDYSKPLDIVWLCKPCHRKYHLGVGNNAENVRAKVTEILTEL